MNRLFVNFGGGLLLLILLALFGVMAWNQGADIPTAFQSPLPTAAPLPVAPCLTATDAGFAFAVEGYVTHADGATTLTYTVTNANKKDISYLAFGAADWTRIAPSDGMTTTLGLGEYQVEWTKDKGNPGFPSIKYETHFGGYSQGATDTFTMTVSGFDPSQPIALEAKAGKDKGRVTITLADPACDRTPPPPPPFSPLPTPTPTPEAGVVLPTEPQVAECVFEPPAGGLPPEEPVIPLSAYSFSEPQVVLTNTAPIGIEQWLPDSETLLVTRHTGHGNKLELVNTQTGEITELLEPNRGIDSPKWLSNDQSVAWRELGAPGYSAGYWIRSFDSPGEQRLSDNSDGSGVPHDSSPDGKEFIFMGLPSGTQPFIWNQEVQTLSGLPIDLAQWRYAKEQVFYPLRPFYPLWHPGGTKILFHDGTWVFLYDLTTKLGCEINMYNLSPTFPSIHDASWSPDGRYILFKIALDPINISMRGPYGLLLILDTYTGNKVQYSLSNSVTNFTWAPDSQTVAMFGGTEERIGQFPAFGFYLLNVRSGEYSRILPQQHTLGAVDKRVQWAQDGKTLAIQCMDTMRDLSDGIFDRICLVHVSINQ